MLLATLVCVGAYWSGLYGPLLLDDTSNLGRILSPEFGPDDALISLLNDSGLLKRPIAMLSFIINGLTGKDLFYWKLTNLIIHLCTGILLYFLTTRLLRYANADSRLMAAIVAAVWLLHPIQVSTVLYTVQRMTELSALFVFAAILSYTIARERQEKRMTAWPLQLLTWLIFFPLGIFSKENALLFPIFILLLEIFLFSRESFNNQRLIKIAFLVLPFIVIAIVFAGDWILAGYEARGFTVLERLYTESRVIVAYLGMLLIPAQRRMGFAHDDFPLSYGLLDPWTTLPSITAILILIFIAFFLRKKHPLIGFGILFFFSGHAMESTVISLELMYEHRNYLPSFGILLATVATLNIIVKNRTIITTFTTIAFCLLIFTTHVSANTWSSAVTLYYYMEMTHPHSERLAAIKSTQFADTQQYALALKRLEGFNSLGARFHRLNIHCLENGRLDNQLLNIDFNHARLADNYAVMQLTDLANRGLDNECDFSSEFFVTLLNRFYELPTLTNANRQIVLMYRAHYLWGMNRKEDALETLNKTFIINKKNPIPLFLACQWLLDTYRMEEAKSTCNTALQVADNDMLDKYMSFASKTRARLESLETITH
ncbi:MAG: hypothetical protein A2V90_09080 [Gammaproteobacteria bacterium RBG_16_57_12]|nr:MAG: hypothetical protein A2V90_09080 [Gammaproteobacteria bacterium RBG_16_57_12]